MNKRNNYIIKNVYKSFIAVSIMSAFIATVGMLIDNIVVGQYLGIECLSAMGVVSPISLIFSAVGNISSSGGATIAARELGRGHRDKMQSIFTVSMLYTLVTGLILTIVVYAFAPQIALLLGAKGTVSEPTIAYLRGFALGAVPTIMMPNIVGFVKIDGSDKLPLLVIGAMSIVDVVLDVMVAVIFHQGMFWMAMATTISYYVAVVVAFTHLKKDYNTLKFIKPLNALSELKEMLSTGAPTAVNRVCDTFKMIIFNNILIVISGAGAVAALNVRQQVYNLVGSLIMGAGQASMPIVALFFGEEDEGALEASMKESLVTGLKLCVAAMVLLLIFPSALASILGVKDPEIIAMANYGIRIFAISMPVRLIVVLWNNFYQSTKHSVHAIIISILQSFVFTTIFGVALVKSMQVNGIFISFLLGEIVTLLYIYTYGMIKSRKMGLSIKQYLLLPETFGKDVINRWEMSLGNDMSQVMSLSEKIQKRAKEENITSDNMRVMSLAVEEMAGNIVKHAFKEGEQRWFDLLILEKKDEFIIRMRDNGRMFNPIKYVHETENDKEHVGIRLVNELASDVQYSRSIGLNNLIINLRK